MFVEFSIQNFGPVRERQTLTFIPKRPIGKLENYYTFDTGLGFRLLKLGLIYGSNASGKSTILKGIEFLREMVCRPFTSKGEHFDFEPFLFDDESRSQNSSFEISFITHNTWFKYEVEFNKVCVVEEKLQKKGDSGRWKNIVTRKTNIDSQVALVKFADEISAKNESLKILEGNTLWNNTIFGGYTKTNVDIKEFKEIVEWFSNYLNPLISPRTDLSNYVSQKLDSGEISKSRMINVLKKADFCITDIKIEKEENEIPEPLFNLLMKDSNLTDEDKSQLKDKKKLRSLKIQFQHGDDEKSYPLDLKYESTGTKRYFQLVGMLLLMLKEPSIYMVDELESSLHPDLFRHFILSFLYNSKSSQCIATTHNREILDDKDLFCFDAIWMTDKNKNLCTELYSLADFGTDVIRRDTGNVLNAYKSGRLGGVPYLSDIYIDLED